MEKLIKTAAKLDKVFNVIQTLFTVLAIVAVVFVGIILYGTQLQELSGETL